MRCAGALVFVHAFAEEMNKSRRMAARQARALADRGWTVLQIDLFGCGDSDGDFGQADWQQWLADLHDAIAWLSEHTGLQPSLWGLRAGCLLACSAAATMKPTPNLLFWQPVVSGRQHLRQFLRLKVASGLLSEPTDRIGTRELYEQLARGEAVEVAGYTLSPALAMALDKAELTPPRASADVAWLDVSEDAAPDLSPAARTQVEAWQAVGHRVEARAVGGPAFWQTQEIAECPELIDATLTAVSQWKLRTSSSGH